MLFLPQLRRVHILHFVLKSGLHPGIKTRSLHDPVNTWTLRRLQTVLLWTVLLMLCI